jgi:ATP-dependent DNA helicase RecQ
VDRAFTAVYTLSVGSTPPSGLMSALRRYWGYSSFRPLQERIVGSLVAGRDACVVMPTGGGKSLCYQLPAAMLAEKTAIVISPLIALMQDQVGQLTQMGISAAFVNSSIKEAERSAVMGESRLGKYRLVYLSPERLLRPETIDWLRGVPVSFFAIDEAHCISEWGHEFRPEYRKLNSLREHFPDRPIAAFTASATRRVRHDIIDQLKLQAPDKYIASFHRPNLRYVVKACDGASQDDLLVTALRHYTGCNVIVYAPTIKRVGETVDYLDEKGIPAIGYHGKMDNETRRRNQEMWMSDDVRVLVGTVAFGLGINKADVRAVIHLSLPKSIEQFYQEAGRAGRDGLPADCLLLWRKRDAGLLAHFIEQITDPEEKDRGWQRYREIRGFVETNVCRHRRICLHFGEVPKWEACQACDVCGYLPEWLNRAATMSPARGKKRGPTPAAAPPSAAPAWQRQKPQPAAGAPVNAGLREHLREWRRNTAKEQGVPAFVVLHDTTLDEICRRGPSSPAELLEVAGIGERKLEVYGRPILDALRQFRGEQARAAAGKE